MCFNSPQTVGYSEAVFFRTKRHTMNFSGSLVRVFIALMTIEFCFLVGCSGSEHCFRINERYVCYFIPYGANKNGEEWDKAWQLCRGNGATLPVIENSTVQDVIEKYMAIQLAGQEVWTAGRGMRSPQWHWLNGHTLQDPKILDNHVYLSEIYDTQAIITEDLKLSGRYPSDKYHYVCQFSGSICQSEGSISFGQGCLKVIGNETVRWYDARNLCIERGGDLPIFEDFGLLNRTQEVFLQLKDTVVGVWIGLRKTWWSWKTTDSTAEIKYSNWFDHDNYVNRECMVLTSNGKRWRQQFCMTAKKFFCQTVKSDLHSMQAFRVQTPGADPEYPHKMMITVGVSIPAVIFVAIASVILATKCKLFSKGGGDRPKDRLPSEQWMRLNGLNGPVAPNGRYAELRLQDRNINPRQKQTELQSNQNAVSEQIWVAREVADVES